MAIRNDRFSEQLFADGRLARDRKTAKQRRSAVTGTERAIDVGALVARLVSATMSRWIRLAPDPAHSRRSIVASTSSFKPARSGAPSMESARRASLNLHNSDD